MLALLNDCPPWSLSSVKIHPVRSILRVSYPTCLPRSTAKVILGEGESSHEWNSIKTSNEPTIQPETTSYAPRGLPSQRQRFRKKPYPILTQESNLAKGAVARFHKTCSVRHRPIIRLIASLTVFDCRPLSTAGLVGLKMHSSWNNSDTS